MLVIRNQQIQNFIAENDDELVDCICESILGTNYDRVAEYDDPTLEQMVRLGIERARGRGMANAEDIAAFVAVMFAVAPRFDEQKDISAALADTAMPVGRKFYFIFETVPDEAWREAEALYDPADWFPESTGG